MLKKGKEDENYRYSQDTPARKAAVKKSIKEEKTFLILFSLKKLSWEVYKNRNSGNTYNRPCGAFYFWYI